MDCQALLCMEFSRQEYWSGLPFPSAGDLPDPGIEPRSHAWQADSLPLSHLGSLSILVICDKFYVFFICHHEEDLDPKVRPSFSLNVSIVLDVE